MAVPTDYSDLRLWLKADAITGLSNGDQVPSGANLGWLDQSGFNFHYTAQGAPRPTYHTNVKNGLPVVRFNGTTAYFDKGTNPFNGIAAATMFIVVKRVQDVPTDANRTGLWDFGSDSQSMHYPYIDGNIYDDFGSTARKNTGNPTLNLTTWHIYSVEVQAGGWKSRLNGAQHFNTATNTVGWIAFNKIGAAANSAIKLEGDIAEIVGYGRVLSDSERAGILAYLDGKWALGLGFAQQTIAMGQATEADQALGIVASKEVALGLPTEVDAATGILVSRELPVGLATEVSEALGVDASKAVLLDKADETDVAQPATPSRDIAVGAATEADSAQGIASDKTGSIDPATEADAALSITPSKTVTLGLVTEADSAHDVAPSRTFDVGTATETDTAADLTPARDFAVPQATEADAAHGITPSREVPLAAATEADAALDIAAEVVPGQDVAVNLAEEVDAALSITASREIALETAIETDAAGPVIPERTAEVGTADEVDGVQDIAPSREVSLNPASESNAALDIDADLEAGAPLDPATEVDQALSITASKTVALPVAYETEAAGDITASRTLDVGTASDGSIAHNITPSKTGEVGRATETDSALRIAWTIDIPDTLDPVKQREAITHPAPIPYAGDTTYVTIDGVQTEVVHHGFRDDAIRTRRSSRGVAKP